MNNGKLFLIRHAQSKFNKEVEIAQKTLDFERIEKAHWSPNFIDSELSDQGCDQANQARSQIKFLNINLVIVSPYKRALQTAKILFSDIPNQKFLVHPGLAEQISHSPDVSLYSGSAYSEFQHFDWSLFKNYYFLLDIIQKPAIQKLKNLEINLIPYEFLKIMKELNKPIESDLEIFNRAQQTKEIWKNYRKIGNIALVGHSNFFKFYSMNPGEFGGWSYFMRNCEIIDEDLMFSEEFRKSLNK